MGSTAPRLNAFGAVKALATASLTVHGDGRHRGSLNSVVATLRQTGLDMQSKYKETSLGGLAVSFLERVEGRTRANLGRGAVIS